MAHLELVETLATDLTQNSPSKRVYYAIQYSARLDHDMDYEDQVGSQEASSRGCVILRVLDLYSISWFKTDVPAEIRCWAAEGRGVGLGVGPQS